MIEVKYYAHFQLHIFSLLFYYYYCYYYSVFRIIPLHLILDF